LHELKKLKGETMMRFLLLLLLVPCVHAQVVSTPTPAASTDPTADTNDPTLLKAQIMILDNAAEVERSHLSQIDNFNAYMSYIGQAQAKRQKLNTVLAQQKRNQVTADEAKTHAPKPTTDPDAALVQANKAKIAADKATHEAAAKKAAAAPSTVTLP
jgi:hypothetical protein